MVKKISILDTLDPDLATRLLSRREALRRAVVTGAAMASVPVALSVLARDAFGQGSALPQDIQDVLNFALTLEELESEFYTRGLAAGNGGFIPPADRPLFQEIQANETAHVAALRSALGNAAIAKPEFDYSGGSFTDGPGSGNGPLRNVFSDYALFKAVSQAFEDLGVRAYKGQAPALVASKGAEYGAVLTTALRVHSVEARHAAAVRRLRMLDADATVKPWITLIDTGITNPPAGAEEILTRIYVGEDNTTQGAAGNVAGFPGAGDTQIGLDAASEAFDEPLSQQAVLEIIDPFMV